ncbi:hypothetical protein U9M48_009201, partial [Paspalum notatum var. saurae]
MPTLTGAGSRKEYEDEVPQEGSSINFSARACRTAANATARQAPLSTGASGSRGIARNGEGTGWSDTMHMFSEEEGGQDVVDEGFCDGSSSNSRNEYEEAKKFVLEESAIMQQYGGMHEATSTIGHEWVMATLNDTRACFNMFRKKENYSMTYMIYDVAPHNLLGKRKIVSRGQLKRLVGNLKKSWICIGAIDGTHVQVVVPSAKMLQYVGRHGYASQNVTLYVTLRAVYVCRWDGLHDTRVFNDALTKYGDKFPHPPEGTISCMKILAGGFRVPNLLGYLAPYKGTKYRPVPTRQDQVGKKVVFNYVHSSLRNVIEHSFGVLKMKWRILKKLPSYPLAKQSKIILACMALHNFIRESALVDMDFEMCDRDENYVP